ncbi:CheR family methyltransferase [Amantichitinum ursilacus]|uniref:Chemotaxis protein methyltransferase Cher2 n=1 Tax=Amantichitinum ursilacus TaxID=857265 RepID=A0A0N0GQZ7_9NEIS|nr:protein-glutamate O-methyltransferase CheR [Amantichitinum ursilacus]KPC55188.1 Chemotaxis protein methyltransferase Cher2 [Amantichitinum ursilacus]
MTSSLFASSSASGPAAIPEAFLQWLGRSTGLSYPTSRYDELWRGLAGVAHELGLADAQAAMGWLMTRPYTHAHAELLASHLSVGETWFLRETPTLDLLEQRLLPELIERRRNLDRTLRIWSAGCCSGEEAWTLAILISRLLPDAPSWRISVVGSDIVPRFLERARNGVYREWSFRGTPPWLRQRWFQTTPAGQFCVAESLRPMVQFVSIDLLNDPFPPISNIPAFDIILCRNVLMYFEPAAMQRIVDKLRDALIDGGVLLTGLSETGRQRFAGFNQETALDVSFYRKGLPPAPAWMPDMSIFAAAAPAAAGVTSPPAAPVPAPHLPRPSALHPPAPAPAVIARHEIAQGLLDEHRYAQVITLIGETPTADELPLLARAHANMGQLAQAARWCQQAIERDKTDASLRYLAAVITSEQGDLEGAIQALRQALFLQGDFVLAHYLLGTLLARAGQGAAAARQLNVTASLLAGMRDEYLLPESDGMTVAQLRQMLQASP